MKYTFMLFLFLTSLHTSHAAKVLLANFKQPGNNFNQRGIDFGSTTSSEALVNHLNDYEADWNFDMQPRQQIADRGYLEITIDPSWTKFFVKCGLTDPFIGRPAIFEATHWYTFRIKPEGTTIQTFADETSYNTDKTAIISELAL